MRPKQVPYFSQWESRELTTDVLERGAAVALMADPRWASSGARSASEYAQWANSLCGMACLKMILAARTGRSMPTLDLARKCTEYGGYTLAETGEIKGLVYAPFIRFIEGEFGIDGQVVTGIDAVGIEAVMRDAEFFIASVHHSIRWPDREPPARGGHLVLVLAAGPDKIVFHNPSGHDVSSQEYAYMPVADFGKFFAGRGVAIAPGDRR